MADPNAITCAACGASGELQKHHLVPRGLGGNESPTVMLCLACHGLVHGRIFAVRHRELTIAGLRAAKARGVKLGSPDQATLAQTAARANRARSRAGAKVIWPYIEAARADDARTLAEIAAYLIRQGIPTPAGKVLWTAEQVRRVISLIQTAVTVS